MSSSARKAPVKPVLETDSRNQSARLNVVTTSEAGNKLHHVNDVFEKVYDAILALNPNGDFLIGHCSPFANMCKLEWTSPGFAHFKGKSIDVSTGPFVNLLIDMRPDLTVDGNALAVADSLFADLPRGEAVLFRVELAGDLVALVLHWQPDSQGKLSPQRLQAIRGVISLAAQAACASDLALDVQAQQLYLDSLRDEIEEVQQFYRQFSDEIRQCFWVVDIDTGKTLVVSDNFDRVWGAHRKILNDGLNGFMTNVLPADRDRVLSDFHLHLGDEFDTELRVIDEDGEVRWIWLRSYPTRDHSSPSLHAIPRPPSRRIVLIADDITDRKTLEETARAKEADLVALARLQAVGDLASGVAHEINNPLTIIVGKAAEVKRLIKKPDFVRKEVDELAEKIQQTSIRISDIVMSLKSLSKNDKNALMSPIPFTRIVTELKDLCTERFKASGVHLEIDEFATSFVADINPTMISQMLLNLLNNAFDAALLEKDKWVTLEHTDDNDSIFLFVTDSGPGVPIKNRSRIFDPFFTTKEPGKGTGLGLTLASSIAAHHRGVLRLDTMHPYTRFTVQLPKRQAK